MYYGEQAMDYERSDFVPDLPENCQYRDEGCELAHSCLNCPFPNCAFDSWGGEWRLQKERRDAEILRRSNQGFTLRELAATYHVSRRTVQRVIRKKRGNFNE
jgi:hypothetical protein